MKNNNCVKHEHKKSIGVCHSCRKKYCELCLTEHGDYYYCSDDNCQSSIENILAKEIEEEKETGRIEEKIRKKGFKSFLGYLCILFLGGRFVYFLTMNDPNNPDYSSNTFQMFFLTSIRPLFWFSIFGFLFWLAFYRRRK